MQSHEHSPQRRHPPPQPQQQQHPLLSSSSSLVAVSSSASLASAGSTSLDSSSFGLLSDRIANASIHSDQNNHNNDQNNHNNDQNNQSHRYNNNNNNSSPLSTRPIFTADTTTTTTINSLPTAINTLSTTNTLSTIHSSSAMLANDAVMQVDCSTESYSDSDDITDSDNTGLSHPFSDDDNDDDDLDADQDEELAWIEWFCRANPYFVDVDDEYIDDDFNLVGLQESVPYYVESLEYIQDIEDDDIVYSDRDMEIIEQGAYTLYHLIHQRFLLTKAGMLKMHEKYQAGLYGTCLRVYCEQTPLLPVGISDKVGEERVRLYCPRCQDIYNPPPKYNHVDGAGFGRTFAPFFFKTFPEFTQSFPPWSPDRIYTPSMFGFRIHSTSHSGSKMRWLRERRPPSDDATHGPTTTGMSRQASSSLRSSVLSTDMNHDEKDNDAMNEDPPPGHVF